MTGLIYCSVIDVCQQAYALERAREWTAALAQWCAQQPEMIAFTATCLVHRAEIMQWQGAWPDALDEARRACERFTLGAAFYQQVEVHRLRGEYTAAEEAYRHASQKGCEPQLGLALLWLAQGRIEAADAAIRRVLSVITDQLQRTKLLPACIEIMLAGGAIPEARLIHVLRFSALLFRVWSRGAPRLGSAWRETDVGVIPNAYANADRKYPARHRPAY
jgi:tetratricopeptide (TPR) repeat protein